MVCHWVKNARVINIIKILQFKTMREILEELIWNIALAGFCHYHRVEALNDHRHKGTSIYIHIIGNNKRNTQQ